MASENVLTPFIKKLFTTPPTLSPADLGSVLKLVIQGSSSDIQTAAFFTALRLTNVDHQPEFISTAAQTVLEFSSTVDINSVDKDGYLDIVGTGGDSQNTFNVSTSAAIVTAGMGLKVCKHGGKASTSKSGSGDLMAHLGVDLLKVNAASTPSILSKSKLCFLFAPAFHPAMGKVAPIRAGLGIPTIFNILGPLLNPAPVRARVLGVYAESLGQVYAEAALAMDEAKGKIASTLVVWGECGLDEISPIGRSKIWRVDPTTKQITSEWIQPSDFGLPEHSLDLVRSGTPAENAVLLREILEGKFGVGPGEPLVDYIVMNSAALAVTAGAANTWIEGVELARKSISSGAALKSLEGFVDAVSEV
ncbi:unnamed protein product [Kuraishia capsulata CBS 1993]|uniref:Anthranilate phosphoribosyltransferase n=1 Tax=Kuraishia capsulata CBS 1993 TaxID=1382522 RepID=W6MFY9_9ASCO|nr:uncharacterized protein KUCA_T00000547001 [Kuraishia capsulata CBS 1993]CDK24581.1 unnamed protein product [Kuraishia capsulata CBS 1993]